MKRFFSFLLILAIAGAAVGVETDTVLKGYFSQGKVPSQAQFHSLIDSKANVGTDVAQQVKGVYYVSTSSSITDHGDAAVTGSLKTLSNTIGTAAATIEAPPGTFAVGQALTLGDATAKNLVYRPQRGAVISHGAYAVTINGTIDAGPWQIFSGTGVVTIAGPQAHVFPEWWGAVGDGVAVDEVALQAAVNAYAGNNGIVLLTRNYRVARTVWLKDNVELRGGTITVSSAGVIGALEGPSLTDNYPINAALQIQSKKNVTVSNVKFVGAGATVGANSANMIYIDYFYASGGGTGSENIKIIGNTFDRPTRFGVYALNFGGRNFNISGNQFILEGCASTTLPVYGSQEGVSAGVNLLYDNANGNAAAIHGLVFSDNTFYIDGSSQTYHGIAYKIQGPHEASITGNTVYRSGANAVTDHASSMSTIYVEDSTVTGNVFGSNVANITSISWEGCRNTTAYGNVAYLTHKIVPYIRGAYSRTPDNFVLDGSRGSSSATLLLGINYVQTTAEMSNVTVRNFRGEVYNYLWSGSSNVVIEDSEITRYRLTNTTCGPITLRRNTIYAHSGESYEINLTNVTAYRNIFVGHASAGSGYYTTNIYNSNLRGNTFTKPSVISTGYIKVRSGSTTSQVIEMPESFVDGFSRYAYYNGTGTYNKSTIDEAAPAGATWLQGDTVWNTVPASGGYSAWTCTAQGTLGTLVGVTGSINTGTATLTVNTASGLSVGTRITIAGVTGAKTVIGISGTTITLNSNADATVASATVAYSSATFVTSSPVYAKAAANADTSGAALGALEAEVNELKSILRTAGILTP